MNFPSIKEIKYFVKILLLIYNKPTTVVFNINSLEIIMTVISLLPSGMYKVYTLRFFHYDYVYNYKDLFLFLIAWSSQYLHKNQLCTFLSLLYPMYEAYYEIVGWLNCQSTEISDIFKSVNFAHGMDNSVWFEIYFIVLIIWWYINVFWAVPFFIYLRFR